ncbi:MAG: phosphatidylserine decarboxylase family protein [Melioribacteraceae bacterium]|nr:phosphatidylserine decarboxylase family protein [Melioribacteraceae bacterium]
MITNYGYVTIGIVAVISFLLIAVSIFINSNVLKIILILISALFLIFTIYFFRDPDRTSPTKDKILVSPADGKVILVKKVLADKYVEGDAWQISIFMSPLNVHVNRIPIDGKVEYLEYIKGEYLMAFHDKADERNERSEFGIMSKFGKVYFTQVAGFIARRIIYDIKIGDDVKIGERFGMIKFGSRVDVVVNTDWEPIVQEGDNVTAGESILFEYKHEY